MTEESAKVINWQESFYVQNDKMQRIGIIHQKLSDAFDEQVGLIRKGRDRELELIAEVSKLKAELAIRDNRIAELQVRAETYEQTPELNAEVAKKVYGLKSAKKFGKPQELPDVELDAPEEAPEKLDIEYDHFLGLCGLNPETCKTCAEKKEAENE